MRCNTFLHETFRVALRAVSLNTRFDFIGAQQEFAFKLELTKILNFTRNLTVLLQIQSQI